MVPKKRKTNSSATRTPSPPQNPAKFITRKAKDQFQNIRTRPFVVERRFKRHSPNFCMFMNSRLHWSRPCEHPSPGVAPIVREFHANLPNRIGSTVVVKGVWVPFDSATINRVLGLADEDSTKYRALFCQPDNTKILRKSTIGQTNWNTRRDG